VRGELHLGPAGIASGPRWSLAWGGRPQFGLEFDLTLLEAGVGCRFDSGSSVREAEHSLRRADECCSARSPGLALGTL